MLEYFCDNTSEKTRLPQRVLRFTFYLLVSILAFKLSWDCNTLRGISLVPKVFYSFFAFNFGAAYLLFYLVFIYGTCGGVV